MTGARSQSHGYVIDVEQLYRAMAAQAVSEDGVLVFHGNSPQTRAVKRLLNDLFDVPVRKSVHPVNDAIRKEAEEAGCARSDGPRRTREGLLHE